MIFKGRRKRLLDMAAIELVLLVVMLVPKLVSFSRTQERINAGQHDVAVSLPPPNKRRGRGSRGQHHLIGKRRRRCDIWHLQCRRCIDVILKRLQAAVAVAVHDVGG